MDKPGTIQIDYTRADMERRMRLLEMADGDLRKAIVLEKWVHGFYLVINPGADLVDIRENGT